ncbi:MAG TPA: hypothetical protein VM638_03665 [Actinomycetota bacterium]|nr:hypothetical protein [Actinomycetota bacterium]
MTDEGDDMDEQRFHDAILALEQATREEKAPEAWRAIGETAIEDFWRAWPEIRAWGQWLWQLVDAERAEQAEPDHRADVDTGGPG